MSAIEVTDVTVARPHGVALAGVSLRVAEGEALGIYGHNGAGKSTLLKLLNGLVRPTSGRVRVLGREARGRDLSWIRAQTAYVPQAHPVDARLPVRAWEVVLMGRNGRIGLGRGPGPRDRDAAHQALSRVGAAHVAHQPFGLLSGGEQQRVLIARALAQEPRLLLLDEPSNSLDQAFQQELHALIREAQDQGELTTVVVSHEVALFAATCERIAVMEAGRIVAEEDGGAFVRRMSAAERTPPTKEGASRW